MPIVNEDKFHYDYYKQFGYNRAAAILLHNELQRLADYAQIRIVGRGIAS